MTAAALHRALRRHLPDGIFAPLAVGYGRALRWLHKGPGIQRLERTDAGMWRVHCTDGSLYITSPKRLSLYRRGLAARLAQVRHKYLRGLTLRPDDVVIDIGANIGEFSLAVASEVGLVVAVEPDPVCHTLACRNLAALPQVRVLRQLLLDAERDVEFYTAPDTADSSVFASGAALGRAGLRLRAITLDALLAPMGLQPTVIKMDAEGAEPEVLAGAPRALASARLVLIDAGPERAGVATAPRVAEMLRAQGFRLREDLRCGDQVVAERAVPQAA